MLNILGLLVAVFLLLAGIDSSWAFRYLDTNISNRSVQADGSCLAIDDLQRFQVMDGGSGLEATLMSEAELVEYFGRLYACDIIQDRRFSYSRSPQIKLYMLSIHNRQANGSFRTLIGLLNRPNDTPVFFSQPPHFFRSLDLALASDEFRRLVKQYGQERVFVEGINFSKGKYIGVFDAGKRQLVFRN